LTVNRYRARLSDIQNTQFPTLAEEIGPQLIGRL
jgi:hypothetical protein